MLLVPVLLVLVLVLLLLLVVVVHVAQWSSQQLRLNRRHIL